MRGFIKKKKKIERWKQQYNTVDLNSLEWVVTDTYGLLEFYDKKDLAAIADKLTVEE